MHTEILYDRETREYGMYLDGELVGFARNYHEADVTLDRLTQEIAASWAGGGTDDDTPVPTLPPPAPFVDPLPSDAPGDNDSVPGDERPRAERCACGAPATWEVPFSTNPHDEYFCDAHIPPGYIATPIAWPANTCTYCDGAHYGWQCPEIARALFAPAEPAPWHDADLGRELCRMRWQRFEAFCTLLRSMPHEHMISYAASYQAFIRSYQPDSDLTISQVLAAWKKAIDRGAARERAAA